MKKILFATFLISSFFVSAQSYQASNEITLIIKDRNDYRVFYSKSMSIKVNMDASEFTFQVDFNTFVPKDTSNKIALTRIFPVNVSPFISFKGTLPFNQLDKDMGLYQTVNIIGNLAIANQWYQITLPVEFKFQDKQLLFDTNFNLDLGKMNITLPTEYQTRINPVFLFKIDNGHFLKRE